jgi:hypothetical protein
MSDKFHVDEVISSYKMMIMMMICGISMFTNTGNNKYTRLSFVLGRAMAQAVSCRTGSTPGQSMWNLWWTKWHWDRFSPPSTSVFPCQFHSTGAPLQGKPKKN